ncbi:hypothetical protein FRC01_006906 [Tulasnella sp. 417]|nr:hypothetical protein FRC01_006906 [Tulasnella sp. 417]
MTNTAKSLLIPVPSHTTLHPAKSVQARLSSASKRKGRWKLQLKPSPLVEAGNDPNTIAGASAGFVSSVVTCPLDVIKTKLQAQKAPKGSPGYLGVSATVRGILLRDGVKGLYRGLGPTMLGYLPTWAIYFTVYDGVKGWLGQPPTGYDASVGDLKPSLNPWTVHLLASVTAGATGTFCTSPLWVVKTRFMTQRPEEVRYKHTIDAFRIIYRNEGFKAFYRGLIPSLFGVTHVLVQFPLYEHLKEWYCGS